MGRIVFKYCECCEAVPVTKYKNARRQYCDKCSRKNILNTQKAYSKSRSFYDSQKVVHHVEAFTILLRIYNSQHSLEENVEMALSELSGRRGE
jgi:hypothetical protein